MMRVGSEKQLTYMVDMGENIGENIGWELIKCDGGGWGKGS